MSRQSVKRFGGKDMLQHIDLARVLFGGMIPSRRDARCMSRQSVKRFGGKDMLQHIDLARVLPGEMTAFRREAR